MKQEDKQLLLKDLCARLPYGVIIQYKDFRPVKMYSIDEFTFNGTYLLELAKPYLRPMSSMTEEEMVEFKWLNDECDKMPTFDYISVEHYRLFDWLNRNHFDFRNLIERGLAIDCTGLNIY